MSHLATVFLDFLSEFRDLLLQFLDLVVPQYATSGRSTVAIPCQYRIMIASYANVPEPHTESAENSQISPHSKTPRRLFTSELSSLT
eukprot:1583651-Rhodomonas_salina.3